MCRALSAKGGPDEHSEIAFTANNSWDSLELGHLSALCTMQAKYGSILYNTVGVLPFGLMSAEMLPEVWKGIATETCKTGFGGGKTCTEALEFTVGKVYLQVICGSALFYAMHLLLEGKSALLASMAMLIGTMGKHILVDDLMPPPPVMAMVALTVALILLAPAAWGRRAYIGFCVVNAATFLLDPLTVITDSFPAGEPLLAPPPPSRACLACASLGSAHSASPSAQSRQARPRRRSARSSLRRCPPPSRQP